MEKKQIALRHRNGVRYAGKNSRTLVAALTGATRKKDIAQQLRKIDAFHAMPKEGGPDIISDLSLYGSEGGIYKAILRNYDDYVVSTLPIYQCAATHDMVDDINLLEVTQEQLESGVSLITIHPTANKKLMQLAQRRLVPWTSRGGAIVIRDLTKRSFEKENVYLRVLDSIIALAGKHQAVISIGASFRSSNILDSFDACQIEEFQVQKTIADYINEHGVGVIIEGPGHSAPAEIEKISIHYRSMGYPIMPLGPIPTDLAIGQDHISSAIGATLLGMHDCADIIAAVTREEHTGKIPSTESSIEAIQASRIAAHIIDLHKLKDYSKDSAIAGYRASHKTCIYGKKSAGCNRCAHVCPLVDYHAGI